MSKKKQPTEKGELFDGKENVTESSLSISRREFFKKTGKGSTVVFGALTIGLPLVLTGCEGPGQSYFSSHQIATMEAVADTAIPGHIWPYTGEVEDDEGFGGAVDAGAWDVMFDEFYGLNASQWGFNYIATIVTFLDSNPWFSKRFKYRSLATRTSQLEEWQDYAPYWGQDMSPLIRHAIMLSKIAFFGAPINTVGTDYVGFPGPSNGYYL